MFNFSMKWRKKIKNLKIYNFLCRIYSYLYRFITVNWVDMFISNIFLNSQSTVCTRVLNYSTFYCISLVRPSINHSYNSWSSAWSVFRASIKSAYKPQTGWGLITKIAIPHGLTIFTKVRIGTLSSTLIIFSKESSCSWYSLLRSTTSQPCGWRWVFVDSQQVFLLWI